MRVATFNCENLFARYRFRSGLSPIADEGWVLEQQAFHSTSLQDRKVTALAMREVRADVLCLQEVESLPVLRSFRSRFLDGPKVYPYSVVIDGPDPRQIDVAVLSRLPIERIRTWQHLRVGTEELFSRDCLEIDVVPPNDEPVTIYVNHFKSMMDGREESSERRGIQADEVVRIVKGRFGADPSDGRWIVCGDLNDYRGTDSEGASAIEQLVDWDACEDVVHSRLPADEQWTQYYKGRNKYTQLDYLLVSKALADASDGAPEIMRKGLPGRAERYTGERFPDVAYDDGPKASDHAPVVFDVRTG
jgi:endonuclease/exonuclease/phosphatase family metal-dependent hydrolase